MYSQNHYTRINFFSFYSLFFLFINDRDYKDGTMARVIAIHNMHIPIGYVHRYLCFAVINALIAIHFSVSSGSIRREEEKVPLTQFFRLVLFTIGQN